MKLLLDTHIWLWSLLDTRYLSENIVKELEDGSNELWLSPISIWEALLLSEKGKLELKPSPLEWVHNALKRVPFKEAPITYEIAIQSRKLNLPHQDPADRFIVATAYIYQLTLITADNRLKQSGDFNILFNNK